MVIVQLSGGLGNQLFQYAAGRALAEQNQTNLKLDIGLYKRDPLRIYKLNHFNIIEDFATPNEIHRHRPRRRHLLRRFVHHLQRQMLPRNQHPEFKEVTPFLFDEDFSKVKHSTYLIGYWQNEKYFAGIEESIRKEFSLKNNPSGLNNDLQKEIQQKNSVSLHVRRGDYASNPITTQRHGTLGVEFYTAAINYMAERTQNPHYYVFSDDIPWVKENLKIPYPVTFVEHNSNGQDYEDLRLMNLCKHNIVANSSFSWWGAWLNQNASKIVIAPKHWLINPKLDSATLIPNSWQLIEDSR